MTELGPEARSLIGAFKEASTRSPESRAALRAGIAEKLAAPVAAAPAPRVSGAFSVKWIGLAVLAIVVGGGAYGLRPAEPTATHEAEASGVPVVVAPVVAAPVVAAPVVAAPVVAAPVITSAPLPPAPIPTTEPPPLEEAPVRASAPEDPAATLRDELAVLREANAAIRESRFGAAITALSRYAQTHTGGTMIEERSAARIVARCGMRVDDRTKRDATRFLTSYPRSPQAGRIRRACML